MKTFLLLLFVAALSVPAKSQGTFNNTGSGLNDLSRYMEDDTTADDGVAPDDEDADETLPNGDPLAGVTMDAQDSTISFDNLPEKGSVSVHITNAEGDELLVRTLRTGRSSVSSGRLPKNLLYATLIYRKYRKAFELNRSEEKKKKPK